MEESWCTLFTALCVGKSPSVIALGMCVCWTASPSEILRGISHSNLLLSRAPSRMTVFPFFRVHVVFVKIVMQLSSHKRDIDRSDVVSSGMQCLAHERAPRQQARARFLCTWSRRDARLAS